MKLYAQLKGYKVFSTIDLRAGYYHIGLSESAKPKTAFVISNIGKYQFQQGPIRSGTGSRIFYEAH